MVTTGMFVTRSIETLSLSEFVKTFIAAPYKLRYIYRPLAILGSTSNCFSLSTTANILLQGLFTS